MDTVDAELDRLISRRASQDLTPTADELEPGYAESVRRFHARRREEMRAAWARPTIGSAPSPYGATSKLSRHITSRRLRPSEGRASVGIHRRLARLEGGSSLCPTCGIDPLAHGVYEVCWDASPAVSSPACPRCGQRALVVVNWDDAKPPPSVASGVPDYPPEWGHEG